MGYVKIDSQKMGSRIYGACSKCLDRAMKLTENVSKGRIGSSSWDRGECDVCHKVTAVSPVRNYDFPVFEIKDLFTREMLFRGGMKAW